VGRGGGYAKATGSNAGAETGRRPLLVPPASLSGSLSQGPWPRPCNFRAIAALTLGVDTHKDFHLALALDGVGIEGTGSFGAGFVRFLRAEGTRVLSVDRPARL
jgi:hypothetical protein